jgi:hypothetical protein
MLIKCLSLTSLIKVFLKKAALALITLVLLILVGCGKKTPPLPPVERVQQRVPISGFQRGNIITLAWTMPARNTKEGSVSNIDRVDIFRLAESVNSSLSLTEEEFASQSTLIKSFPVSNDDFRLKQLTYQDTLDFAGQTVRLRYAIRFVNSSGQKAAFSNFLLIEPTARVAVPPSNVKGNETKDAILIKWNIPQTNIDGSKPANVIGYNIYRKTPESDTFKILNNQPVTGNQFSDIFFEFGKTYDYIVRTVSLGINAEPIESQDSNVFTINPKDTFPPSAPSGLTIAVAPNSLSIFFATNPEKDIAGYRIYRTQNSDLPKSGWQLLNKELLTTNTYQDMQVESGKTYFYYILAVDKAGNVSQASETVSETAQ